jgi:hypothetical protein
MILAGLATAIGTTADVSTVWPLAKHAIAAYFGISIS